MVVTLSVTRDDTFGITTPRRLSMFEDFEKALAEDGRQRRRYCGFGRWLATLPEEHRETAELLVDNEEYNCRQLARYFQSKGAKFNDQVINRHRNRHCCGRRPA